MHPQLASFPVFSSLVCIDNSTQKLKSSSASVYYLSMQTGTRLINTSVNITVPYAIYSLVNVIRYAQECIKATMFLLIMK